MSKQQDTNGQIFYIDRQKSTGIQNHQKVNLLPQRHLNMDLRLTFRHMDLEKISGHFFPQSFTYHVFTARGRYTLSVFLHSTYMCLWKGDVELSFLVI